MHPIESKTTEQRFLRIAEAKGNRAIEMSWYVGISDGVGVAFIAPRDLDLVGPLSQYDTMGIKFSKSELEPLIALLREAVAQGASK